MSINPLSYTNEKLPLINNTMMPVGYGISSDNRVHYQIVPCISKTSSYKERDKLFDSLGYSYTQSSNYGWNCSWRNNALSCGVVVHQEGNVFMQNQETHIHAPKPNDYINVVICSTLKNKVQNGDTRDFQLIWTEILEELKIPMFYIPVNWLTQLKKYFVNLGKEKSNLNFNAYNIYDNQRINEDSVQAFSANSFEDGDVSLLRNIMQHAAQNFSFPTYPNSEPSSETRSPCLYKDQTQPSNLFSHLEESIRNSSGRDSLNPNADQFECTNNKENPNPNLPMQLQMQKNNAPNMNEMYLNKFNDGCEENMMSSIFGSGNPTNSSTLNLQTNNEMQGNLYSNARPNNDLRNNCNENLEQNRPYVIPSFQEEVSSPLHPNFRQEQSLIDQQNIDKGCDYFADKVEQNFSPDNNKMGMAFQHNESNLSQEQNFLRCGQDLSPEASKQDDSDREGCGSQKDGIERRSPENQIPEEAQSSQMAETMKEIVECLEREPRNLVQKIIGDGKRETTPEQETLNKIIEIEKALGTNQDSKFEEEDASDTDANEEKDTFKIIDQHEQNTGTAGLREKESEITSSPDVQDEEENSSESLRNSDDFSQKEILSNIHKVDNERIEKEKVDVAKREDSEENNGMSTVKAIASSPSLKTIPDYNTGSSKEGSPCISSLEKENKTSEHEEVRKTEEVSLEKNDKMFLSQDSSESRSEAKSVELLETGGSKYSEEISGKDAHANTHKEEEETEESDNRGLKENSDELLEESTSEASDLKAKNCNSVISEKSDEELLSEEEEEPRTETTENISDQEKGDDELAEITSENRSPQTGTLEESEDGSRPCSEGKRKAEEDDEEGGGVEISAKKTKLDFNDSPAVSCAEALPEEALNEDESLSNDIIIGEAFTINEDQLKEFEDISDSETKVFKPMCTIPEDMKELIEGSVNADSSDLSRDNLFLDGDSGVQERKNPPLRTTLKLVKKKKRSGLYFKPIKRKKKYSVESPKKWISHPTAPPPRPSLEPLPSFLQELASIDPSVVVSRERVDLDGRKFRLQCITFHETVLDWAFTDTLLSSFDSAKGIRSRFNLHTRLNILFPESSRITEKTCFHPVQLGPAFPFSMPKTAIKEEGAKSKEKLELPFPLEQLSELCPSAVSHRMASEGKDSSFPLKTVSFTEEPLEWAFKETFLSTFGDSPILSDLLGLNSSSRKWPDVAEEILSNEVVPRSFPFACPPPKRHYDNLLFNDLNASLPLSLLHETVELPSLSSDVEKRITGERDSLVRLLAVSSFYKHISRIPTVRSNRKLSASHCALVSSFRPLIISQANNYALAVRDARMRLLKGLACQDKSIIPALTRGPMHGKRGLLLSNVHRLEAAVAKDPNNKLQYI